MHTVDDIFFQEIQDEVEKGVQIVSYDTSVFFNYIDRGIMNLRVFMGYLEKAFPNLMDLIVINNYLHLTGKHIPEEDMNFGFADLYKRLKLRSMIILCYQSSIPDIKPDYIAPDGLILGYTAEENKKHISYQKYRGKDFDENAGWHREQLQCIKTEYIRDREMMNIFF